MEIEANHKCKPEFQGDPQPEINVDALGVSIRTESNRVSVTHAQFIEMIKAYEGYSAALTAALSVLEGG